MRQRGFLEVSKRLQDPGMLCSMSRTRDCWDKAPMQSFFAPLQGELVDERD
ncbi:MAG: hypothetical protein PVS2B3_14690 [Steroidobacteraceae bacterium]